MQVINILMGVIVVWILVLTYYVYRVHTFFGKLAKIKSDNLNELLRKILKGNEASKREFSEIYSQIARIDKEKALSIQKVGFVKYKPFGKEEPENSFIIALLDSHGDGVVITSLQLANSTRVYAKEVVRGRSETPLSNEERKALSKAIKV